MSVSNIEAETNSFREETSSGERVLSNVPEEKPLKSVRGPMKNTSTVASFNTDFGALLRRSTLKPS